MNEQIIGNRTFVKLIGNAAILAAIERMAEEISRDHPSGLRLVAVLQGAWRFCQELCQRLRVPAEVATIRLQSYGRNLHSSGSVKVLQELDRELDRDRDLSGQPLLLLDDIYDSGGTLAFLQSYIADKGVAASAGVLFHKRGASPKPPDFVKYVGLEIPDRFVVGFGLDFAEEGRELDDLYVLPPAEVAKP